MNQIFSWRAHSYPACAEDLHHTHCRHRYLSHPQSRFCPALLHQVIINSHIYLMCCLVSNSFRKVRIGFVCPLAEKAASTGATTRPRSIALFKSKTLTPFVQKEADNLYGTSLPLPVDSSKCSPPTSHVRRRSCRRGVSLAILL